MEKLNMLQFISDLEIGGTQKMMIELINGLDKDRYNITVCSLSKSKIIF